MRKNRNIYIIKLYFNLKLFFSFFYVFHYENAKNVEMKMRNCT